MFEIGDRRGMRELEAETREIAIERERLSEIEMREIERIESRG